MPMPVPALFRILPNLLCIAFLPGCVASSRYNAQRLREEAIVFHQDQIIDNLIRATNKQMILQVKVTALNSSIESTGSIEATAEKTVVGQAAKAVTRSLSGVLNPFGRTDTIDFQTVPIVEDMDAYAPYIIFLKLPEGATHMTVSYADPVKSGLGILDIPDYPFTLQRSPKKPVDGSYVTGAIKKMNKEYYYVPWEYRQPYFELCLALNNYSAFKGGDAAPKSGSGAIGQPKKSDELRALEHNNTLLNRMLIR